MSISSENISSDQSYQSIIYPINETLEELESSLDLNDSENMSDYS
jgi:hypothetical protein